MSDLPATISALANLPVMDLATAVARHKAVISIVKSEIWSPGTDSGKIPGTDKETLLKPGAEKLCSFFGLTPRFPPVTIIEDWDGHEHGGEPLFYYLFDCELSKGGQLIAQASGSCNSRESRYRYRWVSLADVPDGVDLGSLKKRVGAIEEMAFAVDKHETSGKYGKPMEYWQQFIDAIANGTATKTMKPTRDGRAFEAWRIDTTIFRIPNDDIASQVNTILKMAQKRALVAATLIAVNASEFFTQDLEDFDASTIIEGTARVVTSTPPAEEGNGNGSLGSKPSGEQTTTTPPAQKQSNGRAPVTRATRSNGGPWAKDEGQKKEFLAFCDAAAKTHNLKPLSYEAIKSLLRVEHLEDYTGDYLDAQRAVLDALDTLVTEQKGA